MNSRIVSDITFMSTTTTPATKVRLIADIPTKDANSITALAELQGITRPTALVRAIRTLSYLQEKVEAGSTVEVVAEDGTRTRLSL